LIVFGSYSFTTVLNEKIDINVDKSNLHWKGFKVTGSHEGNLKFESGTLTFTEDGKLVDGTFIIDMKSMECTDLEGEYKAKLDGHLKSKDFFGTNEHPSATLQFKEITVSGKNSYRIKGDLTIKGITNSIEFDFSIYGKKATAALKIDRTKYDIKYGSSSFFDGLKDKAIYDDFDIKVDLEF
jgi:polyisoprenoid-binding protein YceI